jgi:salicylate hydroxylase
MALKILIIGSGIAGPAAALFLSRMYNPSTSATSTPSPTPSSRSKVECTIYELRSSPSSIGGSIGLTPPAVRLLEHLGVLEQCYKQGFATEAVEIYSLSTGQTLGQIPFGDRKVYGYPNLRISRTALQKILLDACIESGIKVEYGKKLSAVTEDADSITATFEDGTAVSGDLLVGGDGIHSAVRASYIDPARKASYTGVATAFGYVPRSDIKSPLEFDKEVAGMYSGRRGSLLAVFTDPAKESIFLAGVMETPEEKDRDGWALRGADFEAVKQEFRSRYTSEYYPCVPEIIERVDKLAFYPVYTLDNTPTWFKGRAVLLGDAVHAVSL